MDGRLTFDMRVLSLTSDSASRSWLKILSPSASRFCCHSSRADRLSCGHVTVSNGDRGRSSSMSARPSDERGCMTGDQVMDAPDCSCRRRSDSSSRRHWVDVQKTPLVGSDDVASSWLELSGGCVRWYSGAALSDVNVVSDVNNIQQQT